LPMITFFNKDNKPAFAMCDSGLVTWKPEINKTKSATRHEISVVKNQPVRIDGVDKKLTCGVNQYKLLQRMITFCEDSFNEASKEGFDFQEPFIFTKLKEKPNDN